MKLSTLRTLSLPFTASLIVALAMSVPWRAEEQKDHSKLVEFDSPGTTTVSSPVCASLCGAFAYASNNSGTIATGAARRLSQHPIRQMRFS